ncbi:AAA family ATPase [Anaeromicropila herbilytica]|uniref:ATP-dependent Clp protease ATP-binding subunit ClpA n=1 Tax=Anaeromicropila herbilytica TaxID=2785025 RepID=A0A7R7EJE7_9FIRM|nr:AAA family ATPase [Anaeromicropila herbilytica]BCN29936.1 ATP-dependent Clp protease ATP-binding subunit ClpA [Anaeromicropila herbilytica]
MNATKEVFSAYTFAYELAKERKDEYVTLEHLLYVILQENQDIVDVFRKLGANIATLKRRLIEYLDENMEKGTDEVLDSVSFDECFIMAEQIALGSDKKIVGLEHIMAAIFSMDQSYAVYYLLEQGLNMADFLYLYCHGDLKSFGFKLKDNASMDENKDVTSRQSSENTSETKSENKNAAFLKKYTININEYVKKDNYDSMIGRDEELNRTIQILCRKTKNNPIHIGEPGVGKTAVTYGLAERINSGNVPKKLKSSTIYSIDIGSILAGTKYRGDFEERMKGLLDILRNMQNAIVYIDEIHTIVGAGSLGEGALDASNLLKPYLTEGNIRFIGATTFEEYKKHFEKDKALARRFGKVEIKETSFNETVEILERLSESYENFHQVKYSKEALVSAVSLTSKYMNERYLPDKAIDIIDEAGAYIATKNTKNKIVDESVIEEIIAKSCGIPKQTVKTDELTILKNIDKKLKKNIFGQEEAIDEVVRCIKLSRAGLNDENKPVASMLFVGPTGVGKTEIAKSLAKILGIDLVRFDMSEYAEKHAASKLIGAPPGYVGYEEGGLLTDAIRKKPHCVLLLDEIEKAHEDIQNVLLQIMDYASLTDNQGRKADFQNVILIMTSNAGARNIGKSTLGFNAREIKTEAIFEEVKKIFTPEFRNRLDKTIAFHHVNDEMALLIVKKELNAFKDKLKEKQVEIKFTKKLIDYVAKTGVSKEYGAREIKRIINEEIKPLLVEELLFGKLKNGGSVSVNVAEDKKIEDFNTKNKKTSIIIEYR